MRSHQSHGEYSVYVQVAARPKSGCSNRLASDNICDCLAPRQRIRDSTASLLKMNSTKRRKIAHDAPKKKRAEVKAETKPVETKSEGSDESVPGSESEEESATLEASTEESAVDTPKKTFKDLVRLHFRLP